MRTQAGNDCIRVPVSLKVVVMGKRKHGHCSHRHFTADTLPDVLNPFPCQAVSGTRFGTPQWSQKPQH